MAGKRKRKIKQEKKFGSRIQMLARKYAKSTSKLDWNAYVHAHY